MQTPDTLAALPQKIDAAAALSAFGAGESTETALSGHSVRLVSFMGEGGWHQHAAVEETVVVWAGTFDVQYRAGTVRLEAGQCTIIPRGLEHRGVSAAGAQIMLVRAGA